MASFYETLDSTKISIPQSSRAGRLGGLQIDLKIALAEQTLIVARRPGLADDLYALGIEFGHHSIDKTPR
jgi:hypothetical protein